MKKKTYLYPRISVNQLTEYTDYASATRRTAIIKNAKEKPTYIVKRYNEAEDFLAHFLATGGSSCILLDHIRSLRTDSYSKDFDKECALSSADALDAFYRNGLWLLGMLSKYSIEVSYHDNTHKTVIEGVQISIRPELILRDKISGEHLGFIKFYISKSKRLPITQAEYIACICKYYFHAEHTLLLKANHCFVLDVFSGELIEAPKSYVKRLTNIKASCREIGDRWNLI